MHDRQRRLAARDQGRREMMEIARAKEGRLRSAPRRRASRIERRAQPAHRAAPCQDAIGAGLRAEVDRLRQPIVCGRREGRLARNAAVEIDDAQPHVRQARRG